MKPEAEILLEVDVTEAKYDALITVLMDIMLQNVLSLDEIKNKGMK